MTLLPPFTIVSFVMTDLLEDLGDDSVFFEVDLTINDNLYHTSVSFHELEKYLKQHKPADADYLNKVRSAIGGFGPKQRPVVNMCEEEGYDFEKRVSAFIAAMRPLEHLMPVNKIHNAGQTAAIKKIAADLKTTMEDSKSFNLRGNKFLEEIMELLTNKVLEIYPEIFNSNPQYIIDLQDKLVTHVLKIGEDINELAWKAAKEN